MAKNCFVPVKRLQEGGKVFKDAEGAFYFVDHDHEALKGKEFATVPAAIECINDYNREPGKKFEGELILLNIITI